MGINLKTNFYSPLRYPGGKGKLSYFIHLLVECNGLNDGHYIEPYAGGASVALSMLFNEYCSEIHINDIDYNIYCFWESVKNDNEHLCDLIAKTQVTINEWHNQKNIQLNPKAHSILEVGFSTFFLNRTNRSGILKGGVIGGNTQQGEWKIDARYNKDDLISRIQRIGRYTDRIHIYNKDTIDLIDSLKKILPKRSFYYFDPPYYKKGRELYINYYIHNDHVQISEMISSLQNNYWLVSYDNVPEINELYQKYRKQVYNLNYHAAQASMGSEILIFSDKLLVPQLSNPIDKTELKKFNNSDNQIIEKRRAFSLY